MQEVVQNPFEHCSSPDEVEVLFSGSLANVAATRESYSPDLDESFHLLYLFVRYLRSSLNMLRMWS